MDDDYAGEVRPSRRWSRRVVRTERRWGFMKRKILALGLFSLCAVAFFTGESQAWFGPLNPYSPWSFWNCHNRYVTQITCRPYNAFTPICWGNLVCDGCCPNPCAVAGGCMPVNMGLPPFAAPGCCGPMGGGPSFAGCGPQGCMGNDMMPLMQPAPMAMPGPGPMPEIRNQPLFNAPMPQPLPPGPANPNMTMYPPTGVTQANYPMYPPYNPNYCLPQYYNPYMPQQAAPYYWYGGR
jgi:hypothetical protein